MWYRNKRTGNIWDITDKNILKRIAKDSDHEPYEPEEIEEELPFVADMEEEVKVEPKKAGVSRGTKSTATKAKK